VTKFGRVRSSTLAMTGTWDAEYNLAVVEWLEARGLEEPPENVRLAMRELSTREGRRSMGRPR